MTADALPQAAMRLREWTVDSLRLWAERARLPDGSWVEHLHPDGTPDLRAERRWRVMARQAVAYAQATQAGWLDGHDVAESSFAVFWDQGFTGTHVVHRILPNGVVSDDRDDLYDHAFALLACARMFSLTGEVGFLRKAERVLRYVESQQHPAGGFKEGSVRASPRRQNPHMHLLEASLALFGATGDAAHLALAREVVELFERHFLDVDVVREFFTEDWALDPERGDVVEPGHAVEWVWLLGQFDAATGEAHGDAARALYRRALHQRPVFLFDEERANGETVRETSRLWVQTETVKAHLAMAERGEPDARARAALTIDAMLGASLRPDGTWWDQLNRCGANVARTIPTSTMYHIVLMAVEAERVAGL